MLHTVSLLHWHIYTEQISKIIFDIIQNCVATANTQIGQFYLTMDIKVTLASVLSHCWLGDRKGTWPVKLCTKTH